MTRAAVEAALACAARCRVLAAALDYPSPGRHAGATARWRASLASAWPAGLGEVAAAALTRFENADPAALEAEHVRLFGPAGRAPLVETAWGDAGRLLGRAAALADLGGFYRAFGVTPAASAPRPEDHLAVELEFLSVLAVKEAWALAAGLGAALDVTRDARAKFLDQHLGSWVRGWREAVEASDPLPPWAALSDLIDRVVRAECARAGVAPGRALARAEGRDAECFTCPLAGGP